MIPLRDDIPTRSTPIVTLALIAVNVVVYLYQFALWFEPPGSIRVGDALFRAFVFEFGLIPCRLGDHCPAALGSALASAPAPWFTVFTSMFVHGGFFHVGGNMLYLWIFGNNVEDALGRGRFFLFYLLCGVAAAFAQYLQDTTSTVPMVGASGATSGALGAYLLLYPHARIRTLIVFGFFFRIVAVPALLVLGFWVVVQVANSVLTFGNQQGGVAFLAHVGGFVAGFVLVMPFRRAARAAARRY